ncbi:MAG TPA: hypothetical protein VGY66_13935, partial [Gemmataceae bacterium]|nr:hypothetical protein [Gemmataceae bacterium]
ANAMQRASRSQPVRVVPSTRKRMGSLFISLFLEKEKGFGSVVTRHCSLVIGHSRMTNDQ